ncbi:Histone-lysine N-methyltransferase EHMT2 [Frankliniella fusca]|uniref:Histone-lysine N-methyltransferase EHMT2 n=1 Tax=Frankliniella fusca TaxID=407009 RepID=A0AAE1LR35_9NEOP|nr:Histone-lysine N-methyltransferase EHMT2 [Frankliniella fusca]
MSNPNSFRIHWPNGDKTSKDKPHIKYVLNAMKSNFNPALKDPKELSDPDSLNISFADSTASDQFEELKSFRKNSAPCFPDLIDTKSGKKNSSNSSNNSAEVDIKSNVKLEAPSSKSSASDLADDKSSSKKTPSTSKSNSDSILDVKPNSKKGITVKISYTDSQHEKKSNSKKDHGASKNSFKPVDMGNISKPEVNKRRSEKKFLELLCGDSESAQTKCNPVVNSAFSITTNSSKESPELKQSSDKLTPGAELASSVLDQDLDRNEEDSRKRLARKRGLRNRSVTRSETGSEGDSPASGRKRSARRWSKEGESVLQNAIARKEKSLSSIGKSDDDKAHRAVARSLRESRNSLSIGKRSQSKSQDTSSVSSAESLAEIKSRSPLKSQTDSLNEISKDDSKMDFDSISQSLSKPSSVKSDAEGSCAYTKTGKRRYKPFRGLRYSFGGVTKRSKVFRRSAPTQRNAPSDYFKESPSPHKTKSSTSSAVKKGMNGVTSDKSRSRSPAVGDACTSKAKKSRRENPLAPSPSPGDTPADANHPESTAISFGAGTAGLCLCQSKTNLFVRKETFEETDLSLMCQAVDSLEGRLIGCCNAVGGSESARLYRPSPRVPYVVVCEQHRQRLLRHHCCPGCGNYCTQGRFVQCPSLHYYHRDCQLMIAGKPQCPHCGLDSPPDEVSISLGVQKYPVFLPHQKLVKQTPSARMSLGSSVTSQDQPEDLPDSIAMTLPIATTVLDKGEREKLEKFVNGACSMRGEGRSAHLPRYSVKHLYQSAKSGDSEKIIGIIRHGINPNHIFREMNMRTALHIASEKGHVLAAHVLVQAGAQLDLQDGDLMTPTMLASLHGHTRIVQYLVKAGACVTHQGSDGMTALHIAAKRGDLEICHCLLTNGKAPVGYIDVKDDGGWTALVWSCEFRHVKVARYLLEKRADPLLRDSEQNIALHWAAYSGSEEISERLLNHGCDVNCLNIHGDSPLHVAARQDNLECVLLFLSRGAKPDVANVMGQQAIDCASEGGDCYNAINTTAELRKMTKSAKERTSKILSNDITRGKEEIEIQCLNGIDDESEPRDYVYVTENCFTSNIHVDRTITSLQSCECEDTCIGASCKCTQLSLQSWYDSEGKLLPEFNFFDPPMLFECNEMCSCNVKLCRNRVVQKGFKARFQLFRTVGKGWGVRTLTLIPKGTYVCEYIGEIISDCEADQREDDSYLFDLDNRDGETYCIDACRYGNIARFINHMCTPNLQPVRVFMGHHDLHFPRIAFFANRDIEPQEELGFDYGDKFWIIKYKSFTCTCGAPACKYSVNTIKQTLAEYNKKQEEEIAT